MHAVSVTRLFFTVAERVLASVARACAPERGAQTGAQRRDDDDDGRVSSAQ